MANELSLYFDATARLCVQRGERAAVLMDESSLSDEERRAVKVVWVPTQQLSLGQQFVVGKRQADWMAALPFSIEEQLARPIEEYHLVVLAKHAVTEAERKGHLITFAAITHKTMQQWQAQLQQHGLDEVLLVADAFALQGQTSDAQGVMAHRGDFTLYRWSTALACALPASLNWPALAEMTWQSVQLDLNSSLNAAAVQPLKPFNLLTSAYAKQTQSLWSFWQWPAVAAILLFAALNIQQWQQMRVYQQDAQVYQVQTEALFKSMFPDAKRIVNIRAQTMSRLQSGAAGQTDSLMLMLLPLQQIIAPVSAVKVEELRWGVRNQKYGLTLAVESDSSATLQQLEAQLKQKLPQFKSTLSLKAVANDRVRGEFYVESI